MAIVSLGLWAAPSQTASSWPQAYTLERDDPSGTLTLKTPFYRVLHDLRKGGVISSITLDHGSGSNLLAGPVQTFVRDAKGEVYTDLREPRPQVTHRRDGLTEIVTVESGLRNDANRASGIQLKTVYEYHWGYLKIRREFVAPAKGVALLELGVLRAAVAPTLADYGYREGRTEAEGAPPFSFGSCRWGRLRATSDSPVTSEFIPRYVMLADPGVEGLEWFAGSDLSQWDLQLTGQRGRGRFALQRSTGPESIALTVSPFQDGTNTVTLAKTCVFDFYLAVPILDGRALPPWFHTSFNRNRGDWVSSAQVDQWADSGMQTVHCHNDGDYYGDGLFWRDGSYPPYQDMGGFNKVIADCHRRGIRVATYFSNKELHPDTKEFQQHGQQWGRKNRKGELQHNFFKGKSEFGAQMCLRSGWLDFLKMSIDRVLTNHPLDGVYYDWNVALLCCNGLHEGKPAGEAAAGHWDIDELLKLMEWTRQRVGRQGLAIVHNTTTPMFATENFSSHVVANEWGYGKWKDKTPGLQDLPLEWSLVGARPRGVISYGQIDAQAPKRLHRVFALQALLGGVTPWPASAESFEFGSVLRPLGDFAEWRFADWRNRAVTLRGSQCGSAIYSRAGEAYVLVANFDASTQEVVCSVQPDKLPCPLSRLNSATVVSRTAGEKPLDLDAARLAGGGVALPVPADGVVLLRILGEARP
jgi:hypothetical protein